MIGSAKKKLPVILEPEEARELLKQPNRRYPTGVRNKALLSVMLNMGLRLNESISLKPGDINLTKRKLRVVDGKGKRDRDLFIPELTALLLEEWKEVRPSGAKYFFTTLKGGKLSDKYVQSMVVRYGKRAEIDKRISPHTLRHTFATAHYRQNKDIETLRMILGHSSITTTQIYVTLANIDVENGMRNFAEFT